MNDLIKLIAIVGPTASGKTSLSVELAKAINGEIVCCDSMQIYKKMNIGTAKPTDDEKAGIPHHLFDMIEPDHDFSCAEYRVSAENAVKDISVRGKVPILCGGTGLYLDSLLRGGDMSPNVPAGIREKLEEQSPDSLWDQLIKIDPESAEKTHKNNVKRVVRALEIYYGTGKTKTEWDNISKLSPSDYDPLVIGLDYKNRDILYKRIDKRVDIMLELGLLDEVKALSGYMGKTASQAIGYKELISYINGQLSFEEAVELLKKSTRNYAKRQLTYFKRNQNTIWFYPDEEPIEDIFKKIVNITANHLSR